MTKKISALMDYLRSVSDGIERELFDIHDARAALGAGEDETLAGAARRVMEELDKRRNRHAMYEAVEGLELAWGIIANVDGGDLRSQNGDWRDAVRRWADRFLPLVGHEKQVRARSTLNSLTGASADTSAARSDRADLPGGGYFLFDGGWATLYHAGGVHGYTAPLSEWRKALDAQPDETAAHAAKRSAAKLAEAEQVVAETKAALAATRDMIRRARGILRAGSGEPLVAAAERVRTAQRATAGHLQEVRAALGVLPGEQAIDAVRRVVQERDALRAQLRKVLTRVRILLEMG
jgi:hypothetical protein